MSVTLNQFNDIKRFLESNPDSGYEEWHNQYRPKREKKAVQYTEDFEKWWNTFPAKSTFEYRGYTIKGNRVLKDDKEKTFEAYNKAKEKIDCTDEQMLHALLAEIAQKRQSSIDNTTIARTYNAFDYMAATCAYLNAGKFKYYFDEPINSSSEEEVSSNCA